MATFFFDGTSSQTITFDVDADQVVFELNASDVVSITEGTNGTTLTTTSGNTLLFAGLTAAALADASILPESFLQFGTTDDEDATDGFVATSTVTGGVIFANEGDDSVVGGDAADLLYGNQGDDTLIGGGGNDRLFGGMGDDTITGQNSEDDADENALRIRGGNDSDTIVVAGAVDATAFTATGEFEGAATIYGGNGFNDSADGGDSISVSLADDATAVIYGNGGDDEITVIGDGDATVYGGAGDDSINGAAGGGTGAAIGAGLVYGGLGEDTIEVTASDDTATIYGGNGANDTLDGGDTITIDGTGDVVVYGNAGDDVVVLTSTGESTIFGGMGDDTIAGDATGATAADLGDNSSIVGGLGEDVINVSVLGGSEVEIFGGNGSNDSADGGDQITVDLAATGDATVYGNGGDDEINLSGTGTATVFGGAGEDVVTIEDTGAHVLTVGAGDDAIRFDASSFQAGATVVESDLVSITDLNFSGDTIAFDGLTVTSAADLSDYTPSSAQSDAFDEIEDAANVGTAADAAFDFAVANSLVTGSSTAGVVFAYDGETYLAVGTDDADATTLDVDAIVKITGSTGSFGTSDFGTF